MFTGSSEVIVPVTKENPVRRAFNEVRARGQKLAEKLRMRQREIKDDPKTPNIDEFAEGTLGLLVKEVDSGEPILPSGKRAGWLREGFILDQQGNFHLGIDITSRMSRPGGANARATVNEGVDHMGVSVPRDIEDEAFADFKSRQQAGEMVTWDDHYLDFVGERLGWLKDSPVEWTIPADQIERLTAEQYRQLITWGNNDAVLSKT